MRVLVGCFAALIAPMWSIAQSIYIGNIKDLGQGFGIGSATIELLHSDKRAVTNTFGDFVLETPEYVLDQSESEFTFHHNTLLCENDDIIRLDVYALSGSHIFADQIEVQSHAYIFPPFHPGVYLLKVTTTAGEYGFKMSADGSGLYAVDTRAVHLQTNPSEIMDTLVITKEGYRSRTMVTQRDQVWLEIGLLQNEYADVDYFNELIEPLSFEILSGLPARSNVAEVLSVKVIFDIRDELLYYQNSTKYIYHYEFAQQVLGYKQGHATYNQTQYRDHPDRYLFMGSINYYSAQDKYVLHIVTANEMSCTQLKRLYDKIKATSFIGDKLLFLPITSGLQSCNGVQTISSEELYAGQNYQALNLSKNYGYLRKVSLAELETTYVGRHDIVVLDGIPNDLPVVAGIITTEFQTPLSHINILSHNRGTPNMALRNANMSDTIRQLEGTLVYLNVGSNAYELRPADLTEATAHWNLTEPKDIVVLSKNLELNRLIDLQEANYAFVDRIGGKAANFAELLNVNALSGEQIAVPEGRPFAIPFYFYEQHMKAYGLETFLEDLLSNQQFIADPQYRQTQLEILRDSIVNSPLDRSLVDLVREQLRNFEEFNSFRFRSSTNAEDLEGFSGAGLYDSKTAEKGHSTKTIDNAIRKVWASLWDWRAFEERSYYKIDQQSCAMGLLVHRAFPDEDANGVLLTVNLYNDNPGYTVNVQAGEESIVYPKAGVTHDQFMLFEGSLDFSQDFMIEYLSFSNLPEVGDGHVMTDDEIYRLGYFTKAIKRHFYYNVPHNCRCNYNDFAVDIEFKVDSQVEPRKVYIKQARLY